ncbi:hypothetical protein B0H99_103142 [Planomicrobium soli]|uniref:Uncharacterized protein n=1 Tax=Planomicrobium soli TaxID=1176648 RepID=A0A2P8H475_9BACL|nr:hypothetical protein [Planomicrobium soli]PSL41008.1 hypothetical protein B0H99_103142 [Planomicrobium soli]
MLTWTYVDWGGNIGRGHTNLGFPFYEVEIKGWNDNQHYSDLEDLILVKVIETYSTIEVKLNYLHPDARNNLKARKLAKNTESYLINALRNKD